MTTPATELAWAAGFFDGEGCIRFRTYKTKASYTKREYGCLALQISQVYREPLDRFREAVGGGTVKGPYGPYGANKQPFHIYHCFGVEGMRVYRLLRPYLSSPKTSDGDAAVTAQVEQSAKPKLGNGLTRRRELQAARAA